MDARTAQLFAVKHIPFRLGLQHLLEQQQQGEQQGQGVGVGVDPAAEAHCRSLQREILLMRRLEHPHIVRYLGTRRTSAKLLIFLE